ncbi:hypothetical protein [Paenibacillus sp. NPDC058177]|uniref:hypothetical protein n=1 Tax=Paenibacillus sp. NPDC058177 TaxID=3346369 RepID=UPI0036DBA20E
MKYLLRILGILFSLATIALALYLSINDYNPADQAMRTWSMVTMCGAVIFNGAHFYTRRKDNRGLISLIVGIIILLVVVFKFPF